MKSRQREERHRQQNSRCRCCVTGSLGYYSPAQPTHGLPRSVSTPNFVIDYPGVCRHHHPARRAVWFPFTLWQRHDKSLVPQSPSFYLVESRCPFKGVSLKRTNKYLIDWCIDYK